MKGLRNINIMSKTKFDTVGKTNDDELYMVETPVIVEFYQSGWSWYRLWSDDTIEQGGLTSVGDVGSTGSSSFLKPFASTPYAIASKYEANSYNESSGNLYNITTTTITCGLRWGGDASRGGRYCSWYAVGKIAR